jgi:hypothetical protein
MRDLNHLNLKDLKSICKYYKIEHKSRIKRAELEALIFLAEVSNSLGVIDGYKYGLELLDISLQTITPEQSSSSP